MLSNQLFIVSIRVSQIIDIADARAGGYKEGRRASNRIKRTACQKAVFGEDSDGINEEYSN